MRGFESDAEFQVGGSGLRLWELGFRLPGVGE